jgi:parallel beta-helix repeat protein
MDRRPGRGLRRVMSRLSSSVVSRRVATMAALILGAVCARPAAAQTFNYLDTPADLGASLGFGAWENVDVSAYVPAGATGVILRSGRTPGVLEWFLASGPGDFKYAVRKRGSSDTWMRDKVEGSYGQHLHLIGLDATRMFQFYREHSSIDLHLLGYTMAGVEYFTDSVDKSLTVAGSWQDIDISADTGADTAIGAIVAVATYEHELFGVRPKGSSDDLYYQTFDYDACTFAVVGVDENEVFQMKIESTNTDAYLVGYVTRGAVFFTDMPNVSVTTAGAYRDVDVSSYTGSDLVTGAIIQHADTITYGTGSRGYGSNVGYRGDADAYDYYKPLRHGWFMTPTDPPNYGTVYESMVQDLDEDAYLAGYTVFDPSNYRSIGTNASVLYSTGNASIAAGSRTMSFAGGASLPAEVGRGDKITVGSDTFYIYKKDSATQVTVHDDATSTHTNAVYSIRRAYNTIQTWETARQGNLVADGRREIGVAYPDGDFTSYFTVDGSLGDSMYYMHLTVAEGYEHNGTAGTGVHLAASAASFRIRDHYFRFDGFEIGGEGGYVTTGVTNVLLENLLIHGFDTYGIKMNSGEAVIRNCIVYGGQGNGIETTNAGDVAAVENTTVYNVTGAGFNGGAGTLSATNCIAMACSGGDFAGSVTQSYNLSSDASASGTGSLTNKDPDDQFVSTSAGAENLHLTFGADAVDAGTAASRALDIDGDARPDGSDWDMGADEFISPDIYYVRKSGNDGNDGLTPATAWLTIDKAADTMTAGSWVFVGAGTYTETVTPNNDGTAAGPIRYIADTDGSQTGDAGTVQVGGLGYGLNINDDYHEFVGFTIDALTTGVFVGSCTGFVLEDCEVLNNDAHGVRLNTATATIRGCTIHDNGSFGIHADTGSDLTVIDCEVYACTSGGIRVVDGAALTAERCRTHDNVSAFGISALGPSAITNCLSYANGTFGIHLGNAYTFTVSHCTADGNGDDGIYQSGSGGTSTIRNCIVTNNGDDGLDTDGATMNHTYNLVWGNGTDYEGTTAGTGEVSADPQFISATDRHLQDDSPAVSAGTDLSGVTTVDLDGVTRPHAGGWDMGAYECVPPNRRSIGTYAGTLYSTGNATVAAGSTIVTFGGGADLPESVGVGDKLVIGAETLYVLSRDSATQMTLQDAAAAAHTGAAYTLARAYTTLQAWEDDRGGDLVAEKRMEIGVCYNDGPFTARVTILPTTSSSQYNMSLTVAEGQRHNGTAGTGAVLDVTPGSGFPSISVQAPGTTVEWLEITGNDAQSAIRSPTGIDTGGTVLANLLIHDMNCGAAGAIQSRFSDVTVRNCIIYDIVGHGICALEGAATIQNCSIYNASLDGVRSQAGTAVSVRNTIAVGSGSEDFDLRGTVDAFGYNLYSTTLSFTPGSYEGGNQAPPADLYDLFYSVAAGSENLHLEDFGHSAVDTGADLSSQFATDVDGEPRSGTWDIGADEINPAALSMSSGTDQLFAVGDGPTEISTITITDSWLAPRITAADDIRIRIPDAIDMTWDTFDTIAVLGGPAAGQVSSVVSYEDGAKTLVLDVTTDFAADDSVSISELSFADFGSETGPSSLELDVNSDPSAEATDAKTVEVGPAGAAQTATVELISWREVEPMAAGGSSPLQSVTFDRLTTNTSSDSRSAAAFSHTIGSSCATDGVLVVICATRGDQGVTAVTYDGQPLTEEVSGRAGTASGDEWVSIWYLTDPPLGTNTVAVTYGGSGSPSMVASLSYFGVDQADPIGATASASMTTDSALVTVDIDTTVADSVVVGGLAHHGGDTDPHEVSGDVTAELYDIASGNATSTDSTYAGGEIVTTTAGTYTFEWTSAEADDWAIACVELKPAP